MGLVDKIPLRTLPPFLHTGFFATETGTPNACQARQLQSSEKCPSSREVFRFITLFVDEAFLRLSGTGTQLALLDVFPSQDIRTAPQ